MTRLERDEELRKGLYTRQPIFYCTGRDKKVYYSDTIHGLLEESGLKKRFNRALVPTYLRYWYPASEDTFYQGVKRLLPGYRLHAENGTACAEPFEQLDFKSNPYASYEEATDALRGILADIFEEERRHSSASFLSSGVDSSLLAAGLPAKQVVTVGYDDQRYDESRDSIAIADMLETDIHVCKIDVEEYFAIIAEAMVMREEPTGDSSYIPLYLAAREAAKHTDACCSGEGPDELFCGYRAYQNYLKSPALDYWRICHTCMKTRPTKEGEQSVARFTDGFEKMQAFDLFLATECNLLPNIDAAARGNGIDIRTPLIDRRLFDFAVSVPRDYKCNEENVKLVFRSAAEAYLPKEVAQKPKRAFPVPTQAWMHQDPWEGMLKQTFESKEARQLIRGLIPRYYLKKFFSESADAQATGSYWHPVWTMYTLVEWYKHEFGNAK